MKDSDTSIEELLERFRLGGELIAAASAGAGSDEVEYVPAAGRWSIREIVNHMADAEMVAGDRLRRTIAEDNPTIIGYDQDLWAKRLDYARRPVERALSTFQQIRADNYELLLGTPLNEYARICTHNERGQLTLRDLLLTFTHHAEAHARQIREIRAQFTEGR